MLCFSTEGIFFKSATFSADNFKILIISEYAVIKGENTGQYETKFSNKGNLGILTQVIGFSKQILKYKTVLIIWDNWSLHLIFFLECTLSNFPLNIMFPYNALCVG